MAEVPSTPDLLRLSSAFSRATLGHDHNACSTPRGSCAQTAALGAFASSSTLLRIMAPHFETVKSFADVPIQPKGIDTDDFLLASDGLVAMFDLLGAGVFSFVQADLKSNIAGVRERFVGHYTQSTSLEKLVEYEREEGAGKHATQCLVRLIRGLWFTQLALQTAQAEHTTALHACFRRAYDVVLRHHHTFVVRSVVQVAIRAVPRRDHFFGQLRQGGDSANFDDALARWLAGLDALVCHMKAFLAEGGYGKV
ncbi:Glycolipid transfer protein [Mycena indigotica]|uniref:Glycolipid transfer protein n=1 Tax=Mycena indigotica TaxID=2126181 RepID=A0A8H6RYW3_9AGAR|nr:Glycolipid transfer protein [Mycena indigotica]KAF7288896.1 Glycolipid transfer protein [Mycena indigotica]